jgi:general secretion pathway protein G
MPSQRHQQRGLTLIETVVAVAIVSLFATILGFRHTRLVSQSKHSDCRVQIETLTSALEAFQSAVDRYPRADEGLAALRHAPKDSGLLWRGPYLIGELPQDPWGRPYRYEVTASGEGRVLSLGADGEPGGDGADADVFSWK